MKKKYLNEYNRIKTKIITGAEINNIVNINYN